MPSPPNRAGKIRAFVALKPPSSWVDELSAIQAALRKELGTGDFKWVAPEQIHITLRFFGSIEGSQLPEVVSTIARAADGVAPFVLRAGTLYSFPGVIHPSEQESPISSATQTVNNAVAMNAWLICLLQKHASKSYFGFDSGTNNNPARSTSTAQCFDRSRNPNADTHPQVLTPNVPHYTTCAPRSFNQQIIA